MLFNTKNSDTLLGAIVQHRQNKKETSQYGSILEAINMSSSPDEFFKNNDFAKSETLLDSVKIKLGDLKEQIDGGKISAEKAVSEINSLMTDSAEKTTILGDRIKGFFKGLLNGLVSMVASALLSTAIEKFVGWLDKKLNPSKYIQKAAKKAREEIAKIQSELKNTADTVDNTKQRFAELAQEVNHLGTINQSQGTLSNDEYKEFLDLSNQLAELFPTLTQGYDDNGNAILKLGGDVDNIVGSLERLVEVEKQAANQKIAEQLPDDWAGYVDKLEDYENSIKDLQDRLNSINAAKGETKFTSTNSFGMMAQVLGIAGVDKGKANKIIDEAIGEGDTRTYDLSSLSTEEFKNVQIALNTLEQQYTRQLKQTESTIEKQNIDFYNNISSQLLDDKFYKGLDEAGQKIYQGLLMNFDFQKLANDFGDDWASAYLYIQNDLMNRFENLSGDEKNKVTEYYEKIFSIDTSEGVFAENIEQIKQYIQELADLLGIKYIDLAEIFGLSDIDADLNSVKDRFITNTSSSESNLGYVSFDPRKQKAEQEAKKEYEAFVDSLSKEDFDFWKNALDNGQIPQEVLHSGEQGLKDYLEELQKIADQNEIKVKASDAVDSIADMKSAVASLSDLYNQTVLQAASENADSFGTFAADPSTLNSIESAFKNFIKEQSDSGSDVTELNAALKEFERISVESYGSEDYADQMQSAINNLITAYVDQTDIIKNLDEANAKWSEDQLKAMGITNADAVIMSKLSKKTKELMANVTKLAKSYDKLTEAEEGSDDYNNTLAEMASDITAMLDLDEDSGFTIDTDFVVKNLDLIREAAAGSSEAINQLRKEAAQDITTQIHIEGNPQEVIGYQQYINSLIDGFDIEDIKVGTYLDDNPMIQGLNNLVDAGVITRDSMNAILSGIGVEPEITQEEAWIETKMQDLSNYSGVARNEMEKGLKALKASISVPSIRYKVTSHATGAKYSAPSTSSSSGGGSGGGGGSEPNKPKDESEETFDWIEVAIQRIEEDVSRLDKVIDNTYISWGERNTALADEIDTLADEYEALGMASDEYFRNANEVKVNGGKGLNDDDYGENDELVKAHDQELLDEANRLWATGEYQKKVQEGLLTGDDIEKISNHFLADTIKEYREWYNKGIEKKDAQYDVKLKISGDYEKQFNNVKEEYSELIQYITDQADVIDEKINRTEKRGYFVSKSYYEDLKALEAQRYSKLDAEYEDLIKKRDEAVASGTVEEGSEAWNKMNQEINATNLELEKSKTQMVEYNNTIRQLDWDFFDWVEERISRINSEASFLVDLMSNDQLYNENGTMNNLGHATNAMYAVQYETYMRQAKDYAEERKKLEQDLAKDPANKDLIARYESLVDSEQDAIMAAEQVKNSVKSFVQEGINRFLESLQKLIDKYKEALHDAKDFYDYQKNIANQVKNINNIRKQLLAYEGDDSEETRATVQKLQTQLEDAETQLKETQWDKYISETETFLSDMYTNMEETLNARLDNIDLLMHDMIDVANANADNVRETIAQETSKVGYDLSDTFDRVLNSDESRLVTDLNKGFTDVNTALTNVQSVIEQIKNFAAAMVDNGKANVDTVPETDDKGTTGGVPQSKGGNGGNNGNNGGNGGNNGNGDNKGGNNPPAITNTPKRTDEDYYGVALAIINDSYGWGTGEERFKKLREKGFD